jgi:hypothetical protein
MNKSAPSEKLSKTLQDLATNTNTEFNIFQVSSCHLIELPIKIIQES